jgi:Domain of unknown function (DUF4276)
MVREIRIYIEGGGNRSDTRAAIREGFSKFLDPLCQLARKGRLKWFVAACGSREDAFENFRKALETHPDAFLVLLVDSEAPVVGGQWEHLQRRGGWDSGDLRDDHCHLMVQTVEAWLLADPDALSDYYGQGFRRSALPRRDDVEAIPKDQLYASLKRATSDTKKGSYHKIRHCADLLGLLNRDCVRQRARHCDLLFRTLEARITGAEG